MPLLLTLNAGSSSLKFAVFDAVAPHSAARTWALHAGDSAEARAAA